MNIVVSDFKDCECGNTPCFRTSIRGDKKFLFCQKCGHCGEHMKTLRGAVIRWNKLMLKFSDSKGKQK